MKWGPGVDAPGRRSLWGGRSVEEIAEELEIRPGTVKSRLARGRAMLRANVIGMNLPQKICQETLREVVEWSDKTAAFADTGRHFASKPTPREAWS